MPEERESVKEKRKQERIRSVIKEALRARKFSDEEMLIQGLKWIEFVTTLRIETEKRSED